MLLVIVPLGSIAFSTMGGNRMVSHTAVFYSKYFLSVVLEAVTMALTVGSVNGAQSLTSKAFGL